jgi:hypothetical protein
MTLPTPRYWAVMSVLKPQPDLLGGITMSILHSRVAAVAAGAALLVGVSSVGAVAGSMITSKDIKNDTVRSVDVHDNGLYMRDLSQGVQKRINAPGPRGETGATGAQGEKGDPGAPGAPGPAALANIEHWSSAGTVVAGTTGVVQVNCPTATKTAISGGFSVDGYSPEVQVLASRNTIDSKGWLVYAHNNDSVAHDVRAWVICADANVAEPTP